MSQPVRSQPRPAVLRRSFNRTFPAAVRGEGALLWDFEGKQYLDFSGSAAVNLIGHGVREIADAMSEQARTLEFVHTSQFTTPVAEEYAHELLEFAGENFRGGAVFFTCGGSEAVESALKLARQYQVEIGQKQRFQVFSRRQSYHGATLGALAVSGNVRRRQIYLPMVREFEQISLPYCYRCRYDCKNCGQQYAAELEPALAASKDEVAAFIVEPVSGATLGAAVPPQGYLQEVAAICRRHGVLLIADEVMTGMGRTGRNFAVEHWGVAPDIIVTAKGMSSGYAPLGAVIASERAVDAIASGSGSFTHGFTYNAHPVSVAAGRAVLRHIRERKLVRAASQQGTAGAALKSALDSLHDLPTVGDVRGIGLLWGIEFVADTKTKQPFPMELNVAGRVGQAAAARGLLVYPMQGCVDGYTGDHLLIAPPAVISTEQIAWAVDQLRSAVEQVATSIHHRATEAQRIDD
ncbi:MAG TPA: aspartate aminotransferase family protein [Terriglobales bacterium]|nr:aspartate aminotransferase family protein [Terriglobales bacterium]